MIPHYHFIGIAGIGMSALARILLQRGWRVTGSDPAASSLKASLKALGAEIFDTQAATNIVPGAHVVYSSGIATDNPELLAVQTHGCRLLHRADLLAELAATAPYALAVTGTHGKTTTTSLLTTILQAAGSDPSFAIGGMLLSSGVNGGGGNGPHFVFEADESDGSMLRYFPYGAIITNIDTDHLLHYGSMQALEAAICTFAGQVQSPQHLLWCGDDERLTAMQLPGKSYGYGADCHYRITRVWQEGWRTFFDLQVEERSISALEVSMPGRHLVLNATGAVGLALQLGIDEASIRTGLRTFGGVGRRFERVAEHHHVLVIDDYAHHPVEIAATLEAIRAACAERRLIAVYQPHRYSRLVTLPPTTFSHVFDAADEVYITDIYAAGETPIEGVGAEPIYQVLKERKTPLVHHASRQSLLTTLIAAIRPHDVVVMMGAGDLTRVAHELAAHLAQHPPQKWRIGLTFGGPSPEHAISLTSARSILAALNPQQYEVELFGVTRQGEWIAHQDALTTLSAMPSSQAPQVATPRLSPATLAALQQCDLFFPIMHGPYGEDGIVQAFFEVLGKPYVGCGHRSAALCMDKVASKKVVRYHGLATAPFVSFSAVRWRYHQADVLAEIYAALALPLIVKPSHIGSSVGLGLAHTPEELIAAITEACRADDEVLVEQRLFARDIEFAILGSENISVLPPGEILTNGKPYDYLDKVGAAGPPTTPLAVLPPEWLARGCEAARTAYHACGCQGWARIDFLLDSEGTFWFNEANPIPGMTAISLYPQMCQQQGITMNELMQRLVIQALARHRSQQQRIHYTPLLKPVI